MFTGLIEGIGKIKAIRRLHNDVRMTIGPLFMMTDCQVGDSMSVDGVCLTLTEVSGGTFSMDVSQETLSLSTLGLLRQGDEVNLERALRLTDRLGGHLVSGHVDGIGKILKKESDQRSWLIRIGINEELLHYTIEKGSIAVDGISLTVNRCGKGFIDINVIPLTGADTTILKKVIGDPVNIETDLIGKYVEKFILRDRSTRPEKTGLGVDLETLIKQGFGD